MAKSQGNHNFLKGWEGENPENEHENLGGLWA